MSTSPPPIGDPPEEDDDLPARTASGRFVARAARPLAIVLVLALLVPAGRWAADELAFGTSRDAVVEELGDDAELTASLVLVRSVSCTGRAATGSGFVVELAGAPVIVTNRHVVDDARAISVRSLDGATVIEVARHRVAMSADVAVLELGDEHVPGPALPTGSPAQVGDEVRVVGFPSGRPSTGTGEVISSTSGRLVVDAPVSSGVSGSPLLDTDGRVVGQVYATTGDGHGVATPLPVLLRAAANAQLTEGCGDGAQATDVP